MEQQIKLAAKLYRCRDSTKGLFGDEYRSKIEPYVTTLNEYAERKELDIFKAVLEICDMPGISGNGMLCILFMAAAVEILELIPDSMTTPH